MAEDAYLKIEGLEGECPSSHHEKWIEITNFSFSISSEGEELSTPSKAGRPQPIKIDKAIDITSPKLALAVCWRKPFKEVTLELCTAVGSSSPAVTFMRYVLKDTFIKSYDVGGGGDGDPEESFELVYDSIKMTYFQLDHATGEDNGVSAESEWSISKNSDKVE